MKYTTTVDIHKPRTEVIEKLDNAENMKHWQRGLQEYHFIKGTPGTEGAQMELRYKMGKRDMTMIETILKRDFPTEFHATYDAKGVHNIQKNYFEEIDPQTTRWRSESEFQFQGFGMKLIGFLMPGAFKKQSQKYLNDFKNFVEHGTSVENQS
ncbi:MAG: SRPBCC family protein [Marinirhabdus sp.]|nr:SRPBCC family protein [Marinirhabdus sp.]